VPYPAVALSTPFLSHYNKAAHRSYSYIHGVATITPDHPFPTHELAYATSEYSPFLQKPPLSNPQSSLCQFRLTITSDHLFLSRNNLYYFRVFQCVTCGVTCPLFCYYPENNSMRAKQTNKKAPLSSPSTQKHWTFVCRKGTQCRRQRRIALQ
jgi:hypothetical protein